MKKKQKNIINPFSFLILILISTFVISLVKHQRVSLQRQTIRIEVVGQDWASNYDQQHRFRPPYWLVENLRVGAQELSSDGRVISEIVDIDYSESIKNTLQVFLIIELETINNFGSGKTIYKGKNIEVGEKIEFHFNNSFIVGQITDAEYSKEDALEDEIVVGGIYRNVPISVAEKIHEGMQIVNPFTNKIYATIEKIYIYPSSNNIMYESNGSILRFRSDYRFRDIEISVRLFAKKHLGEYYFNGNQIIRVGEDVSLVFSGLKLGLMEITNVSKIDKAE